MNQRKWYSCNKCGKTLSSYHSLWRHRKVTCGKENVNKHVNKHVKCGEIPKFSSDEFIPDTFHEGRERDENIADQPQFVTQKINQYISDENADDQPQFETQIVNHYSSDDSSTETTPIKAYTWCNDVNQNPIAQSRKDTDIATYAWQDDGSIKKNHSALLPRDIRAIIVGKSGFGKTTLLTYLLLEPEMMDYEKLMVCGKSLHQPEYKAMELGFDKGLSKNQVRTIFRRQEDVMAGGGVWESIKDIKKCKGGVDASFYDDVSMIPDPSEHDAFKKNLLILDDIMLGPQNKVEAYFTRGRHNNIDVIYIAQSYFRLPRQTIREKGNLFMFFSQDRKNLVHIFNDHCSGDGISLDMFCKFCNNVWREDKHFVVLSL